jgi:hypothetical protein
MSDVDVCMFIVVMCIVVVKLVIHQQSIHRPPPTPLHVLTSRFLKGIY